MTDRGEQRHPVDGRKSTTGEPQPGDSEQLCREQDRRGWQDRQTNGRRQHNSISQASDAATAAHSPHPLPFGAHREREEDGGQIGYRQCSQCHSRYGEQTGYALPGRLEEAKSRPSNRLGTEESVPSTIPLASQ
jgi:hypothetical protein